MTVLKPVKISGLTPAQQLRLRSECEIAADVKAIARTKTTVTYASAEDVRILLEGVYAVENDVYENEPDIYENEAQYAFAHRAWAKSFASLQEKLEKAIKEDK